MFWNKKSAKEEEKLRGPAMMPGPVQKYLVAEKKMAPDLAQLLKAVVHKGANGETAVAIRIFDESEALAEKISVKDYATLDAHPELIIYEGSFDDASKRVELVEKKKISSDTPIFTEAEIRQKIEALSEPGSTAFFYMNRGSTHGGPLGMGAAVIELNASYPGKKQKKYNVYTADVVGMQPVGKGQKLFDADKPKEIANWVKQNHDKRMY